MHYFVRVDDTVVDDLTLTSAGFILVRGSLTNFLWKIWYCYDAASWRPTCLT